VTEERLEYSEYDNAVKRIREKNGEYLTGFAESLSAQGLSDKTIKNHITNVDFYINHYLLYEEPLDAAQGCGLKVSHFLGYWFITKAMWSSVESIKSTAASIKKFYKYLLGIGVVAKADYDDLLETIKEEMPEWLQDMQEYDEGTIDWLQF